MTSLRFPLLLAAIAMRAGAQDVAVHLELGRAAYAVHNADAAVKEFEKAVSLDDKNAECHRWLARAIGLQSETASFVRIPGLAKRMKTEYERAVALDSTNLAAHQGLVEVYLGPAMFGGSIVKAHEQADAIAKLNAMRGDMARATIARHEKDTATVEREWRNAAAEFPDSLVAANGYAELLASMHRNADAITVIDKYTARRPNDVRGVFALGRITAIAGVQLDRGEQALRTVLAVAGIGTDSTLPPAATAHYWLGEILRQRGATAEARQEYQRALDLNPHLDAAKKALRDVKPTHT